VKVIGLQNAKKNILNAIEWPEFAPRECQPSSLVVFRFMVQSTKSRVYDSRDDLQK